MDFAAEIRALAEAKQRVDHLTKTHSAILMEIATSKHLAKTLEESLRENASLWFQETGDRSPHDALNIKHIRRRIYATEDNMFGATDNAPQLLRVDADKFAPLAPALAQAMNCIYEGQMQDDRDRIAAGAAALCMTLYQCLTVDEKALKELVESGAAPWAEVVENEVDTVFLKSRLGEYLIEKEDETPVTGKG